MHRIKLLVSYDGTDYSGWQIQAAGQQTVQGTLERALEKIFLQPLRVHGSGRTDAGAHALGQVCHFDAPRDIASYNFRKALGRWTPDSIAIRDVWHAPDDFHSLFSAQKKTYKYRILNSKVPSALRTRYTWWVDQKLELETLQRTSQLLLGEHDFKSFQTSGTDLKTGTVRSIYAADWRQASPQILEFSITGSGFLKQMVRNIVGTVVDLTLRQERPEELQRIMAACDRRQARATAPAHGLYLYKVYYPHSLDKKCRKL
jgi:tRNA pseudouridine38-40 synthase